MNTEPIVVNVPRTNLSGMNNKKTTGTISESSFKELLNEATKPADAKLTNQKEFKNEASQWEDLNAIKEILSVLNESELLNLPIVKDLNSDSQSSTEESMDALLDLFGEEKWDDLNGKLEEILTNLGLPVNMDVLQNQPTTKQLDGLKIALEKALELPKDEISGERLQSIGLLLKYMKFEMSIATYTNDADHLAETLAKAAPVLTKWEGKLSTIASELEKKMTAGDQSKTLFSINSKPLISKIADEAFARNIQAANPDGQTNLAALNTKREIKANNIALDKNQSITIHELQLQNQKPVLILEKNGQSVNSQEFAKAFENLMNKSTFTNQAGVQKLFIRLTPEHLGTMQIELIQKNGQMIAKIMATTQRGRELLESQLHSLKQVLANQGIIMDKGEIQQQGQTEYQGQLPQRNQDHREDRDSNSSSNQDTDDPKQDDDFAAFLNKLQNELINETV